MEPWVVPGLMMDYWLAEPGSLVIGCGSSVSGFSVSLLMCGADF